MLTLNYNYLEKLISESKKDQKVIAAEMGLPEKFFSRLKADGSNLNVSDLCLVSDYFDANVEDLLITGSTREMRDKIKRGKELFSKYYEYEEKSRITEPPDIAEYKSSWLSDIHNNSTYINSPEQKYLEKSNSYNRILNTFNTMDEILTQFVCQLDYPTSTRKLIRNDLLSFLTYGIRECSSGLSRTKIASIANKACICLINEMEFKKLL